MVVPLAAISGATSNCQLRSGQGEDARDRRSHEHSDQMLLQGEWRPQPPEAD